MQSGREHLLAVYTFGQFLAPYNSEQIKGFRLREPLAFSAIERAAGFVARSGYDGDPGPASWGRQVYPKYWADNGDGFAPSTISVWTSPEALMAAAYYGAHGEALQHRHDWQQKGSWPGYVLWWVGADHRPTWTEAVARHEQLGDEGPTPSAFSFKAPFGPDGGPYHLDKALMKEYVRQNDDGIGY